MRRFAIGIVFVIAFTLFASYAFAQNYDAVLRHDVDPKGEVFSHFDINLMEPAVPNRWFADAIWFDNNFVISGDCAYSKGSVLRNAEWGDGGLYLFTANGTYLSKYDVCLSFPSNANQRICGHEDFCEVGTRLFKTSNSEFIADLSSSYGFPRPPVVMQVSGSQLVRKASVPGFVVPAGSYGYAFASCSPGAPCYALGHMRHFDSKLIGVKGKEGTSIDDPFYEPEIHSPVYTNVLYDSNSLSQLASWPMSIKPLAAGGDFVISRGVNPPSADVLPHLRFRESIDVYKIVNNQPQLVRHLMDAYPVGSGIDSNTPFGREFLTDPLNPQRLIFQTKDYEEYTNPYTNRPDIRATGYSIHIYEPGANDISLVKSVKLTEPALAVAGNYVVSYVCSSYQDPGQAAWTRCLLNVTKNGQPLTAEPLPPVIDDEEMYTTCQKLGWSWPGYPEICNRDRLEQSRQNNWASSSKWAQGPIGVSISPNGDMLVLTRQSHVYMYKINNFQNSGNPGNGTNDTTTPPPPNGTLTQTLALKPGWNLVSSPLAGSALFASHQTTCTYTSPLWAFDSGTQQYEQTTQLTGTKKGMWIRAAGDCAVTLTGSSQYAIGSFFPLALGAGWNFIAGPPAAVQVSELTGCTITRGPFWYNPSTGWEQSTALEPGKGYALRAASSCSMSYGSIPPLP